MLAHVSNLTLALRSVPFGMHTRRYASRSLSSGLTPIMGVFGFILLDVWGSVAPLRFDVLGTLFSIFKIDLVVILHIYCFCTKLPILGVSVVLGCQQS